MKKITNNFKASPFGGGLEGANPLGKLRRLSPPLWGGREGLLLIAFMAILGTASAVAQTATTLSFEGDRAKIESLGRYYIPQEVWSVYEEIFVDIVNGIEPEIGYEGWTETNSWGAPAGSWVVGNPSAQHQQYIRIDVPGLWTNYSNISPGKALRIRRIADPILRIGSVSKRLSEWTFPQTVEAGETAELIVDEFFVDKYNRLYLNGVEIDRNKTVYTLTQAGEYELRTRDGYSDQIHIVAFQLVSNDVPVTGISLNHTSMTKTVGSFETLVATIMPTDATNQGVIWESSNTDVATINPYGTVAAINVGTTTITATTVDGGHTATCIVTVIPQTYTIALSSNNADWGTVSGEGTFDEGSPVTVSAIPVEDNSFLYWEEGGIEVSTQAEYSFTVNTDRDLLAVFQSGNSIDEIEAALKFFSYDGKVYIESPELIKEVSAYDVQGKLLKTMLLNSTRAAIGKFDPQILTIKIKIGKKTYAKKILVN